ncbi:MAG: hypothetical protein QF376_00350 [Anaerolineales bacterium]|jgi:hypothetical protein|nr:hypothetical protein [Anaerolineales bacterium]HJO33534.1 hypothetical protein [Anaerolineales bacterium]
MPNVSEVVTEHKVTQTPSLPETSGGVGFHYYPDSEHYRSQDLDAWLPEMQSLGVSWLTVRGDLERAIPEVFLAPLLRAGITPIVHIPVNPIQTLDPDDLRGLMRAYANWGVQYVVVFDRANMRESWQFGAFEQRQLPERFVSCWLPIALAQMDCGLRPVLPPLQQGGTYWDTSFYSAVLQSLADNGAQAVIDRLVLGVYSFAGPRPPEWGRGGNAAWRASQPYLTPPGSQDQRGFWSFEWYAEVFDEVLGEVPPMIMLAGGARRNETDPSSALPKDLAWHTTCNASIARAMVARHLPDYMLNVNFWLLCAAPESQYAGDAWFSAGAEPLPAASELKRLGFNSTRLGRNTGRDYVDSLGSQKPLRHYVLLPSFDWGPSEWHWQLARPLMIDDETSCGYSLEAATNAEKVTIVGDENEIGVDLVRQLHQAGCQVSRVSSDPSTSSAHNETVANLPA